MLSKPSFGLDEVGNACGIGIITVGKRVMSFLNTKPSEHGWTHGMRILQGSNTGHIARQRCDQQIGLGLTHKWEAGIAGRAGDVGKDPLPEFIKSIKMAKSYKNVKILWASVREPYNYIQACQIGCDIITVPPKIIEKIENFGKSFERLTLETVKAFLIDSKKSKFKI